MSTGSGTAGSGERLLDGLDPQQRAVVTAVHGPVVVVAGAGTGKTRAITRRIAYGVEQGAFDPTGVLAVTFTTRAAAEMRARLAGLGVGGVVTRTFHSAALSQARYLWPRLYGQPFPELMGNPESMLADLATAAGIRVSARDLATEVSWAKVTNVAPATYVEHASTAARRVSGATPDDVARLYLAYVDALAAADRVDMDDVLLATVGVLTTQPAAARVVRQRYRWFTVDECQDVSPLQMRLLECWLGDRDDVCVVGDPRQSIYAFAGARADLLESVATRFERATRLNLSYNYRSTPQVLEAAAAVLPPAAGQRLRPTRPAGRPVQVLEAADQQAEAHLVARTVADLIADGLPERDIAVLTRTQAQARVLARTLATAGLTVAGRGATPFYERPDVRQGIALLAAAARRETAAPVQGEDRAPGAEPADTLTPSLPATVREVFIDAGWQGPDSPPSQRTGAWHAWATLVAVAEDVERMADTAGAPTPTLGDLVAELRDQARVGREPAGAGVTVATLHAIKGQQWSAVVVTGAHDGGIPARTALSRTAADGALAEEQRLFYVGCTRAADHLVITWARRAQQGGPARTPSRFLAGILDESPGYRADRPAAQEHTSESEDSA